MSADDLIVFDNVSRFYGDVLGVNNVSLSIPPGITSLVGPNGAGKTTLMNLMTGLILPTQGAISVLGISPRDPENLFRAVGYCTQFDNFPRGMSGYQFIYSFLRVQGYTEQEADRRTWESIGRVNLKEAALRKVAGYSKGMRQRIKLAQALSHNPRVLILDEPLNGLDPMARAETIALFEALGAQGVHVIVSSHILHEVDRISDQVILLSQGYVVAEGQIQGVRSEVQDHPIQVMIRCDRPGLLASRLFEEPHVTEARIHTDRHGLMVRTRDADTLYLLLNRLAVEEGFDFESIAPGDEDVHSIYQYLIGAEGAAA
ncbi:MAG TPA: ABC transporter ATP-binding protein [Solibacterales bacterium]|nr:ABC transporter ATP-binding protein [Bryobacterales bacterium]